MTTAVDTSVLLALLIPGDANAPRAADALTDAAEEGALVLCEPVYAELAPQFPDRDDFERFLADTRLRLVPSGVDALVLAGRAWAAYVRRRPLGFLCSRCGAEQTVPCGRCGEPLRGRQHGLADFLIGAHAQLHADRLVSFNSRFYRSYFPDLRLL
jgi:predicted nucleic acid-binding protein